MAATWLPDTGAPILDDWPATEMASFGARQSRMTRRKPAKHLGVQVGARTGELITMDDFDGRQKAAVGHPLSIELSRQGEKSPCRVFVSVIFTSSIICGIRSPQHFPLWIYGLG